MKCKTCGNESLTEKCINCTIGNTSKMHELGLGLAAEALSKKLKAEEMYGLAFTAEALSKKLKAEEMYGLAFTAEALSKGFEDNEKMYGLGSLYSNKSNIQKESSLELERKNNLEEIEKLEKKLIEERKNAEKNEKNEKLLEESKNKILMMEDETKLLQEKNSQNDKEIETLKSNEKKVEETIDFIDKLPSEHLSKLKNTIEHRIKVFNRIGFLSLLVSGVTFLGYFCSLLVNLPAPTTAVSYFNNVFFIVFPTIVAFTSYRQSNLKSEELEKINEKLLNSNYLVASLQAIQKISKESDRDDNVLVSINKLIDSILYKKDEKKVSDDLDINEVKTALRDVALIMKTFNK